MTSTATAYRKTKTGEWVVFGPSSLVHTGAVTVTKRDGTTKAEHVERVGKTFIADGIEARYGYIARPTAARGHTHASALTLARTNGYGRYECGECGECVTTGTVCWEDGHTH